MRILEEYFSNNIIEDDHYAQILVETKKSRGEGRTANWHLIFIRWSSYNKKSIEPLEEKLYSVLSACCIQYIYIIYERGHMDEHVVMNSSNMTEWNSKTLKLPRTEARRGLKVVWSLLWSELWWGGMLGGWRAGRLDCTAVSRWGQLTEDRERLQSAVSPPTATTTAQHHSQTGRQVISGLTQTKSKQDSLYWDLTTISRHNT